VVDVAKARLVVDMDLHVEGEQFLLWSGSLQEDIWGINLHPRDFGTPSFLEFDSLINIRPRQNRSRGVDDPSLRQRIIDLASGVVHE
jgi:hypothetical protein